VEYYQGQLAPFFFFVLEVVLAGGVLDVGFNVDFPPFVAALVGFPRGFLRER
jgi:hypothetical protein